MSNRLGEWGSARLGRDYYRHDQPSSGAGAMQERRQYPRFMPDSALLVSLNSSRRGFLSDLSEGGMAFEGFLPQTASEAIQMAFRLPESADTIEAKGEIVWTNDSRQRTGVRFVELADATQQQLRQWLSLRVFISGEQDLGRSEDSAQSRPRELPPGVPTHLIGPEIAIDRPQPGSPRLFLGLTPARTENAVRSGAERDLDRNPVGYSPGLVAGVIVLCLAFVVVGYYLPSFVHGPKPNPSTQQVEPSRTLRAQAPGALPPTVPESQPGPAPETPVAPEGFVLQVGAMAHRENADALVDQLQKKNFPAFVATRARDRLYRVDVGPYPDAVYARGVQEELKAGGFDTVLERQFGPPSR